LQHVHRFEHAPKKYAPRLAAGSSDTDGVSVGCAPVRRSHDRYGPRTPAGALRDDHANGGEQVRGLSPAQLEYKASPDRWTIRQVVSHLAVAEPDYWREIQKALKAAPDMKDKKSSSTDADIMWYGIDRVVHTKTGGGHEKVDTYKGLDEALGKFQALRATMIEYIKTTPDDMRAHSFGDYGDAIDCWQWMLEISTHAERHIQQIREIKNDPKFPKN